MPSSPTEQLTLYVDGASRGNPGRASIGVSVLSKDGTEVAVISKAIGIATNNTAEYTALLEGLKLAADRHAKNLCVYSDSLLLVQQLKGVYKVKNENLIHLFRKAKVLMGKFESIRIQHIPRDRNKRADALANEALDAEEDLVEER